jgi:hypothetical protein
MVVKKTSYQLRIRSGIKAGGGVDAISIVIH